ncbi:MAG: ATP-grasp domain-containing protein [Candidatus Theseobacter exili]|nr:ATP-grasp domain-containing protein [Candidatus Theseobacter exili]
MYPNTAQKERPEILPEGSWGWFGQRAHDGVSMCHLIPFSFIYSCDSGPEVTAFSNNITPFSVEKMLGFRRFWSNKSLDQSVSGVEGQRFYSFLDTLKKPVYFLCYRSFGELENLVSKQKNFLIVAVPERIKNFFDNKIIFRRLLKKLGIPKIPGETAELGNIRFPEIVAKFGRRPVVQFPYGSSGLNTFFIETSEDLDKIQKSNIDKTAILSRYLNGYSLNINAVVFNDKGQISVHVSQPSLQIVGPESCAMRETIYCGNDFTSVRFLDSKIVDEVREYTRTIGKMMAHYGYKGIFGIDFIVHEGKPYPLEINPRFQNSTPLQTLAETKEGAVPIVFYHINSFLNEYVLKDYLNENNREVVLSGSQLILHNLHKETCVATGHVKSGVYRVKDSEIEFIRDDVTLTDSVAENEIVVAGGMPQGMSVESGAPVLKMQRWGSVLGPDLINLNAESEKIAKFLYDKLKLVPADSMSAVPCEFGHTGL